MDGLTPEAQRLAAIVAVVVVLWFTEALPLAVTALLGATACVILGVAPAKEVFRPFADPIMFLFIGSFLLAEAIRIHRLDRRLAFAVLAVPWVGERPTRILAAIALVSAAISSFISNTVTAALMTTIVAGILHALEHAAPRDRPRPAAGFATGLFLSVAFAASIGGLATPVGTPTNLIGLGLIRRELDVAVTFAGWCAITLPVVAILLVVLVAVLGRLFPAGVDRLEGMRGFVAAERARLGPWSIGQVSTAAAFAVAVGLWVAPGVALLAGGPRHPVSEWLRDRMPEGVAALAGAILLFVLPGDRAADGTRPRALRWEDARMALGELCFSTGLATAAGRVVTGWIPAGASGPLPLVAAATASAAVTSEFTSNVTSATMVVPVAIAVGQATQGSPFVAALAATLGSSLGFMMPVSSPCNAIVYGSGRIPLRAMMATGAILDVAGFLVITAAMTVAAGWLAP
jgi:solute carrier family 13 (sodium-dependent dicarboxylate transporter), member 2/3/5